MRRKPRMLDLYCGAGGMSRGFADAGFEVVGVDKDPQPNYPYTFFQFDVLDIVRTAASCEGWLARQFDAIHASPPCQRYSVLRHANVTKGSDSPDLIAITRDLLVSSGLPWSMENVPGAPLFPSVMLCGSMFGLGSNGRQLRRHRLFECSFEVVAPPCRHEGEAIGVYGGSPTGRYTFENGIRKGLKGRRGGYQGTIAEKREAMGIDWMNGREINQAMPPRYGEWIGTQSKAAIEVRA